jgi:hypothetical protein
MAGPALRGLIKETQLWLVAVLIKSRAKRRACLAKLSSVQKIK